jgi:hypothetical protein
MSGTLAFACYRHLTYLIISAILQDRCSILDKKEIYLRLLPPALGAEE